jgi:hypothetical protein
MIQAMSDIDHQYYNIVKNGYAPTNEMMIESKQKMAELNRRWQQFMTYYKAARKNRFNANQEVEKAGKVYTAAQKARSKHYDKMSEALKESNAATKQYRADYSDYHNAKVGLGSAKDSLKEHMWKTGMLGGLGFLTIGVPYILRNQQRQSDKYAALEQAGEMDPANGWYEAALYDEMDDNFDKINAKVKEAKKKYETKSKSK